jgi:sugar/nucleoside kinase (ribokinase family)
MACTDVVIRGIDLNRALADYEGRAPVDAVSMAGGGDALNEAIVLGNLGHDVALIAGRGNDGAGAVIRHVAERAGVDMSLCIPIPGYITPISVVNIGRDLTRKFIAPVPGNPGSFIVAKRFVPDIGSIKNARVVSLASLFTAPLDDPSMVARIAKKAKAEGSIVCADTKPIRSDLKLSDYAEALPYIDYIFPNEEEAALYAPGCRTPGEIAAYFRSFGVRNVLIKMAERGVRFEGAEGQFHVPAFEVELVDSTGCGDNFAAGFISALLQGMDACACCAFANATASICAESVGASTGVTGMEQVRERLSEGKMNVL